MKPDTIDEMVRDFTAVGSRPKSEVRTRIEEHTRTFKREILLEVADCWGRYAEPNSQGFAAQLRKQAEKL